MSDLLLYPQHSTRILESFPILSLCIVGFSKYLWNERIDKKTQVFLMLKDIANSFS